MAAWEIMNEPEGGMDINHYESDGNTCFNPERWHKSNPGMGFELKYPMKRSVLQTSTTMAIMNCISSRILRFFNWITAAIHSFDSKALVTVGAWKPQTNTDKCSNCYNIYRDECLVAAGGKANGKLDFYQMHTYEWSEQFPMKRNAPDYGLDKPLIVGEFSTKRSGVSDSAQVYKHYYFGGYNGALAWQYNDHSDNDRDSRDVINHGMESIRHETSNGVIAVKIA